MDYWPVWTDIETVQDKLVLIKINWPNGDSNQGRPMTQART